MTPNSSASAQAAGRGTNSTDAAPSRDTSSFNEPTEHVTKRRASVLREVGRLLDDLAPERPPTQHDAPAPDVQRYRAPGRCILQGAERAVSVSWFPGLPGDDALGELQVIVWTGVVTLPGTAPRARTGAQPERTMVLHPVSLAAGRWEWRSAADTPGFDIVGLAAHCRRQLEA
jgi:hypothetical protein